MQNHFGGLKSESTMNDTIIRVCYLSTTATKETREEIFQIINSVCQWENNVIITGDFNYANIS